MAEPASARSQAEAALPVPAAAGQKTPLDLSLPGLGRDSYASTAFGEIVDRSMHAAAARYTFGLSPAALAEAYLDWAVHLAFSPGKQLSLVDKAWRKSLRLATCIAHCLRAGGTAAPCIEPLPQDKRFADPSWASWPFNIVYQSFLLNQQWWHNATTGVRGVTRAHENAVAFAARQILDTVSPSNFLATNPVVLRRTWQDGGFNLIRGAQNLMEDWERAVSGRKPVGADAFQIGRDVATTPGKIVYRNRLIELIQYAPATEAVRPEPVLIVPAWIMKYYILDLSPENSLVRYLTQQGFTVFMISWKNPDPGDRDLGMEDYRELGVMAALDAVMAICNPPQVHSVGYCLGGTLLAIAAAAMARDGDARLKSMTLLAAQTDFTEAGELTLFINESQLSFLEDMMWEQGFLDARQMSGAFQILNSNDLIWSRIVHEFMMGERREMIDLMAWNADATRMPFRMHSEYLRHLFLDNDLAEGRYHAGGKPVALNDVHLPVFAVGTVTDHVAPWRSVHKIHLLTDTEVTFVLTTGGHNAGIISELGRTGRSYQVMARKLEGHYIDPGNWAANATRKTGSWWPEWVAWLTARSGEPAGLPPLGQSSGPYAPLGPAPGTYVLEE